jgi:hypothetical protein
VKSCLSEVDFLAKIPQNKSLPIKPNHQSLQLLDTRKKNNQNDIEKQ